MFNNVTSPLSTHDVNRLAPASIDVSERHAGNPAIASHAPKIVPAANEVLDALVDLEELKIDQVKLVAASSEQTAVLNGVMLKWSGALARDIEGFDIGAFARDASLTFDVLRKAIGLERIVENKGADLPYREVLLAELTARIDGTREADTAAKAARVAVQEKQHEIRELSARFHKELVSFRRTVRGALGSKHFDYQRLRVTGRAAAEPPDEETDAASEAPSEGTSDPGTTT
jgi:hypothetical protein